MPDKINDRTQTAHDHDDRELIENSLDTPAFGGTFGHTIAQDIGSADDLKRALEPDAGVTNADKSDKVQPKIATRADFDGGKG